MHDLPATPQIHVLTSPDWQDYELLDSGAGQKLERYGPYRFVRPEPEAVWKPALPEKDWKNIHAAFIPSPEENGGRWKPLLPVPERWPMQYKNLRFWASLSASRHIGLFPEQACQWDWITSQIQAARRPLTVLNLFGYTGLASLAAASAGARVTHLEGEHPRDRVPGLPGPLRALRGTLRPRDADPRPRRARASVRLRRDDGGCLLVPELRRGTATR